MNANARILRKLLRPIRNEDGAALVYFGLSAVMLLGCFALAVDVGAVLNARSEAQRAADAAALAGASEFMKPGTPMVLAPLAEAAAYDFAGRNTVAGQAVDPANVEVTVDPDQRRVSVAIRASTPGLFASFIGKGILPVYARATAEASGAGGATCVKPFALPDMWRVTNASNVNFDPDDPLWQGSFDPNNPNHVYKPWDGTLTDYDATGYGAPIRNGEANFQNNRYDHDYGRKIVFKTGSHTPDKEWLEAPFGDLGGSDHMIIDIPGNSGFNPVLDRNGNPVSCDGNPNGGGAALARANVCMCNMTDFPVNGEVTQIAKEPGNKASITKSLRNLINADPNVRWDNIGKRVVDEHGNTITQSPRIIKVALYDPSTAPSHPNGMLDIVNIGLVFVENIHDQGNNVSFWGRFLMYASGTGEGSGTTVRTLRLIE